MIHVGHFKRKHGKWPSPSVISQEMLISRPAVTAILNSLEKQGYVRRVISPADRRRFTVELTPLGQQMTRDAFGQFCRTTATVMEVLGEEDSRKFQELLEKVTAAMEHEKGVKG